MVFESEKVSLLRARENGHLAGGRGCGGKTQDRTGSILIYTCATALLDQPLPCLTFEQPWNGTRSPRNGDAATARSLRVVGYKRCFLFLNLNPRDEMT